MIPWILNYSLLLCLFTSFLYFMFTSLLCYIYIMVAKPYLMALPPQLRGNVSNLFYMAKVQNINGNSRKSWSMTNPGHTFHQKVIYQASLQNNNTSVISWHQTHECTCGLEPICQNIEKNYVYHPQNAKYSLQNLHLLCLTF